MSTKKDLDNYEMSERSKGTSVTGGNPVIKSVSSKLTSQVDDKKETSNKVKIVKHIAGMSGNPNAIANNFK